ncbi:hypothetical protein PIB30_005594 [Stylosanthes scabra]|uniref:Pentatricopeptide repeat-containing protein n=1 Tax=Stylosanthes scabra TaxID=79078 RepID=A0ABU6R2Z6_9FABA|nr:hypothetical protein [Stylosanthes scabra]
MATSTLLSYNFHHPFRQNPRVNHVATVIPNFSSPRTISLTTPSSLTLSHTFKQSTLKEAFQSLTSLSLTYPFSFQFSHHDAFSMVLDLCGSEKAVLQGQQVHALLVKTCGLCGSVFLGTKLVHMYGKCGFFSDAQKVFDRMPDRTVFTWNAMLGACVSSGKHVKALELFREMRVVGVEPDAFTFPCVLKACGALADRDFGDEIHGFALKCGFAAFVFVCNALIAMYAKCHDLHSARTLFLHMEEKDDPVSWNSVISAHVSEGSTSSL